MPRARVDSHEIVPLSQGWRVAGCLPGLGDAPEGLDALDWVPARVPGTAAGALRDAGLWRPHDARDFDAEDWWFATAFAAEPVRAGEEVALRFDGIATLSEVFLNGERILTGRSMFAPQAVEVGRLLQPHNDLLIHCSALGPVLRRPRSPRARWRTRVVADGNLRFYRTMLLGRAPGFAPGPAAVGPWRPVWLERRRQLVVEELAVRPRLAGADGLVRVDARLRPLSGATIATARLEFTGPTGIHEAPLALVSSDGATVVSGELELTRVARWWPHTHGEPELYEASIVLDGDERVRIDGGRIGFRELDAGPRPGHDIEADGLDLHVNGVPVFCRGAVWTPLDAVTLAPETADLRRTLERVRDAGMNMLRVPGTACYEEADFYALCDELGILVWQDFMFSNLDYPIEDEAFRAEVVSEARAVLAGLGRSPSLAVLCGNSEVEQQVAMLGLDPALGRGELFGRLLPELIADAAIDVPYVPSTPFGGDMPFRPGQGIAHYYEVGGFFRPVSAARRAGVRFAAECLPFANVPDDEALSELFPSSSPAVHDPRWKLGVPRDVGQSWDFDDVRDFYLADVFALDPVRLRRSEPELYLELSRAATGEVMADVFGEWRRDDSPCRGGLILWLRDLVAGAGWGILDSGGRPKVAYHYLRRALAPLALWTTDEGVGGIDVHVANDRATAFKGRLRVALYRDFELAVGEESEPIELAPHSLTRRGVEEVLGRFVDVAWAHRFGSPGQDVVVATLEAGRAASAEPVSQSFRFPVGLPTRAEPVAALGLEAQGELAADGSVDVRIRSRRLAYCVRVRAAGFEPVDDAFCLEPGHERRIRLEPTLAGTAFTGGEISAANLRGRVRIELSDTSAGPRA